MPEPRQLLHYTLTRKPGEGGMGEVRQATDTTLDRHGGRNGLTAGDTCGSMDTHVPESCPRVGDSSFVESAAQRITCDLSLSWTKPGTSKKRYRPAT